jgi:hypothetical protein
MVDLSASRLASSLPALHIFNSQNLLNCAFGKLESHPTTFSAASEDVGVVNPMYIENVVAFGLP